MLVIRNGNPNLIVDETRNIIDGFKFGVLSQEI